MLTLQRSQIILDFNSKSLSPPHQSQQRPEYLMVLEIILPDFFLVGPLWSAQNKIRATPIWKTRTFNILIFLIRNPSYAGGTQRKAVLWIVTWIGNEEASWLKTKCNKQETRQLTPFVWSEVVFDLTGVLNIKTLVVSLVCSRSSLCMAHTRRTKLVVNLLLVVLMCSLSHLNWLRFW